MKTVRHIHWLWFMLGLGMQLQIVASLSFTELFCFMAAPLLISREFSYIRRNGLDTFLYLSVAVMGGCIIASIANHSAAMFVLRGMAVTTLLPCVIIVGHWILRKDPNGFKWIFIGNAISGIICTFFFQKSAEVVGLAGGEGGSGAVDAIISGPIFWITRLYPVVMAVPQGWYLECPLVFSMGAPVAMALFSLFTSVSGRSAALSAIASAIIVCVGGKQAYRIRKNICERFWWLLCMAIVGIFVAKGAYSFCAEHGFLGESAAKKYERQTKGDKSLKALLLGGRMESFCGLIACVEKPIIGFGPWATDENGYLEEFLSKYANEEDYTGYLRNMEYYAKQGVFRHSLIPCHAYITEFWLWYGIFGLVFWLYVMFVLLRYLRQDCWAVPQWYLWLAASIPGYFWGIFFSPWSSRVFGILFVVACLVARAVRKGSFQLPQEMIIEIAKAERR